MPTNPLSTDRTQAPPLEIAHVLFMDIVEYSKLPMDDQRKLLRILQELVAANSEVKRATREDRLVRLPTGDGMALVFFGDPEAPARCAVELGRALQEHPQIRLRMGLHTGPVYRVEDINANRNVSGGGINIAQRVMDCGDARHILVSKSVADVIGQVSTWSEMLHDLGEAEVKHGLRVHLHNLYVGEVGNSDLPQKLRRARETASAVQLKARRKRLSVRLVAACAVTALAIVTFFYSRRVKALTEKDTIVLSDFTNTTGDAAFDDALKQGLAVAMNQSPFLDILSAGKVEDTIRQMGRKPGERLGAEVMREVCQRVGSKAMVAGSIAQLGRQYVVGLNAMNCNTGDSLAQEQARAATKEDVLEALDRAAVGLRRKLGESLSSVQKFDVRLAVATTPSLAALKVYSMGEKVQDEKGDAEAVPFYKQAIELDSNFALAYSSLGTAYSSLGEAGLASENHKKAFALRDRLTEREKYSISGSYYMAVTGELDKAIHVYELYAASYPRDTSALVNLAFIYQSIGQYEKAVAQTLAAIHVSPTTGGYENLVGYYVALDRFDDAKAAYQNAPPVNFDLVQLHGNRYSVAFLEGDTAEMERQVAWSKGKAEAEDAFLNAQSSTEAFFGRLGKARSFSRQAVDLALRNEQKETAAMWELNEASREAELGNHARTRAEITSALGPAAGIDVQIQSALASARAGDSVRAQLIGDALAKANPVNTLLNNYWLPTIRASIEINRNQPEHAVELLQSVAAYELAAGGAMYPAYLRGQAFLMNQQGTAAVAEFQKIVKHRGIVVNSPLGALAHLGLARSCVLTGDKDKARAAYRDFLTLWKDADPDIPILKQANAEYAKLQ